MSFEEKFKIAVAKLPEILGKYLEKYPNVVGFDTIPLPKKVGGQETAEKALVIYVEKKVPETMLAANEILPKEINGIKIDVVEVGKVTVMPCSGDAELLRQSFPFSLQETKPVEIEFPMGAEAHRQRVRPIIGGISFIGPWGSAGAGGSTCPKYTDVTPKLSAGSINCVWQEGITNKLVVLSNYHVIFNNTPRDLCTKVGDPCTQPGGIDGGKCPDDTVAYALSFAPLSGGLPGALCDAALAEIRDTNICMPGYVMGPDDKPLKVKGWLEPKVGMYVWVSGRTSGFAGPQKIVSTGSTFNVTGYGCLTRAYSAYFQQQVSVQPRLIQPGDSGSPLLTKVGEDWYIVGLNFAGGEYVSIANNIKYVVEQLNLVWPGEVPPPPTKKYAPSDTEIIYEVVSLAKEPSEIVAATGKDKYSESETVVVKGKLCDKNTKEGLGYRVIKWVDEVLSEAFSGAHTYGAFKISFSMPFKTKYWVEQTSGEVITDPNGEFTFSLVAKGLGKHRIKISFAGDE
jgi:hypothetical protein